MESLLPSSTSSGAKAVQSCLDESKLSEFGRLDIADAKESQKHAPCGDKEAPAADSKDTFKISRKGELVHDTPITNASTRNCNTRGLGDEASPTPRDMAMGFRLREMSMRDCSDSGTMLWHSTAFSEEDEASQSGKDLAPCFRPGEMSERVPKQILECRTISRDICFSSIHVVQKLCLKQRVCLHGKCIEEWEFDFGFVMPGSVNTWQQVIEAAPAMIPADVLSGNVTFENCFFDGKTFLCRNTVRLFYV